MLSLDSKEEDLTPSRRLARGPRLTKAQLTTTLYCLGVARGSLDITHTRIVQRLYEKVCHLYRQRRNETPPSEKTVRRISAQFEETGQVETEFKGGRKRKEVRETIEGIVKSKDSTSVRELA